MTESIMDSDSAIKFLLQSDVGILHIRVFDKSVDFIPVS